MFQLNSKPTYFRTHVYMNFLLMSKTHSRSLSKHFRYTLYTIYVKSLQITLIKKTSNYKRIHTTEYFQLFFHTTTQYFHYTNKRLTVQSPFSIINGRNSSVSPMWQLNKKTIQFSTARLKKSDGTNWSHNGDNSLLPDLEILTQTQPFVKTA